MKTIKKKCIALLVTLLSVSALWFNNRVVTPKDASWADVESESGSGKYNLITTDELWKIYSDSKNLFLMVDTRQEWEFRTGHMKGAVNFPMEPTWLSRWQKQSSLKQFLGPDKDKTIIFY